LASEIDLLGCGEQRDMAKVHEAEGVVLFVAAASPRADRLAQLAKRAGAGANAAQCALHSEVVARLFGQGRWLCALSCTRWREALPRAAPLRARLSSAYASSLQPILLANLRGAFSWSTVRSKQQAHVLEPPPVCFRDAQLDSASSLGSPRELQRGIGELALKNERAVWRMERRVVPPQLSQRAP